MHATMLSLKNQSAFFLEMPLKYIYLFAHLVYDNTCSSEFFLLREYDVARIFKNITIELLS